MFIKFILVFCFFYFLFNMVPKYHYLYIMRGTKLINQKKVDEGLLLFEKGAYGKKVDYMTKIRYAFLELKMGSLEKAKKMIMYILSTGKVPLNIRYEAKAIYALIQFKEGEINEAKETMLDVYENYKTTNMYCTLGYLFNILESPKKAVELNEEAYEYNSEKEVILDNLGEAYFLNDDVEKAYEIYEKLMEKNPAFPEAYYNYARVLDKKGDREKAEEMLSTALEKPFNKLTTVTKEEINKYMDEIKGI